MLELLYHYDAGAFTHDKAIAITIEWTRGALRLVIARAERFHRAKSGEADLDHRRFRSAGEKNVGVAEFDHAP